MSIINNVEKAMRSITKKKKNNRASSHYDGWDYHTPDEIQAELETGSEITENNFRELLEENDKFVKDKDRLHSKFDEEKYRLKHKT